MGAALPDATFGLQISGTTTSRVEETVDHEETAMENRERRRHTHGWMLRLHADHITAGNTGRAAPPTLHKRHTGRHYLQFKSSRNKQSDEKSCMAAL